MNVHKLCCASAVLWIATLIASGARANDYSGIELGLYLARAGDCVACHTADGGKPYAGGRPVPTPFGVIYSTNITPDKDTGIGNWSDEDFYRAMHYGVRPDGKHYYPAFPYPWFTKVSRADVLAIKSFLATLAPVRQDNKPTELPWPLNWRGGMAVWNALFFDEGVFKPDLKQSAQWNRGAYLVEGLSHCGACHTPKNFLGGDKRDQPFAGGFGEDWFAPNLRANPRGGLGAWTATDIAEYLKTGSTAHTAAAGPMGEVIGHSTQFLADGDLQAIAAYLKTLTPYQSDRTQSVDAQLLTRGEGVYLDQCAGCHMKNGESLADVFPALKATSSVQADDATTLIRVILGGARGVASSSKPTALAMPAFAEKLPDQDISAALTYIRNAWGNSASPVSASDVAKVRKQMHASVSRAR